jgi:hypothetical protein
MKKTIILALALALVGGAAYANFCARDIVPAASLLVPYIVVDADASGNPNPAGYTTLTVVTNVSSTKQLIHVTVWNAVSSAVVDFDEVLSGYDVWSINWRDVVTGDFENFDTSSSPSFWTGTVGDAPSPFGPTTNNLPTTFVNVNDPQDTDYPTPAMTNCGMPWGNLSQYKGIIVSKLQAPLTAWTTQDTNCDNTAEITGWGGWLSTVTNAPLFFYATIDTVNACNALFPSSSDYWNGGYNTRNNVLTGYDYYLNFTSNYSESLPTVNLEAYAGYTGVGFYTKARVTSGTTFTQDDREPLGTAYAFNYFNSLGVTTNVDVWKNYSEFDTTHKNVLACRPYVYYAWDENEQSKSRTTQACPSGLCFGNPEPNVFPFETQSVPVTSANFNALMSGNGWMLIVFDPSVPNLTSAEPYLQAYVFAKYNYGAYSTAVEATTMGNYWCAPTQTLPALNTNTGGGLGTYGILYQ